MTITVETGTIVDGANSYVTLAEARAYVTERGKALPSADAQAESIIIQAMDFFESHDNQFKGSRVTRDQPLSFPRSGVYVEEWTWAANEIPRQVISAQLALIFEINAGEDPFNPPVAEQHKTRKTVGPITVEYSKPNFVSKVVKTSHSSTHINLLLENSGLNLIRS